MNKDNIEALNKLLKKGVLLKNRSPHKIYDKLVSNGGTLSVTLDELSGLADIPVEYHYGKYFYTNVSKAIKKLKNLGLISVQVHKKHDSKVNIYDIEISKSDATPPEDALRAERIDEIKKSIGFSRIEI